MLSRIAESLFWVGRYLERAEDTARILDVQIHQLLEDPTSDEALASRVLLSVMGVQGDGEATLSLGMATALLAFDRSQPSSIVSSLVAARENARGVREAISSELWECLNATHVSLGQRVATTKAIGPHAFFRFARFVKERVAIAAGIADATMSRDDGWSFLVLGRSLERVDMTARLLGVRASLASSPADWVTTLRCCSAHEAYLRAQRSAVEGDRVVQFLLLDRLFPRSAYPALTLAESCVAGLDTDHGRLGPSDEARRVLGQARADLEYRRFGDLLEHRPEVLADLELACSAATRNELRLTPLPSSRQAVATAEVQVTPFAPLYAYQDYWGTAVHAFDLHDPHGELDIVGRSVVDTGLEVPRGPRLDWDELTAPAVQDHFAELLVPTTYTPLEPELEAIARDCAGGLGPPEAVDAVLGAVQATMRYESGTTHVTTSALQAWRQASGVCQDFAHVSLALLRHLRLPTRYVSGYLHPTPDAAVGEVVSGASHAWIEVFLGTWHPFDPTNGAAVAERHVAVAHGRDYADVAPVVGVYQGGNLTSLAVDVTLERLA